MSLLNTTVAQLAKWVNLTLTMAYRDIYGEEEGENPAQLTLLTSPLSSTDEVAALYTAGLAPVEIAMPAVLHSIGASKDEIERVTKEAKDRDLKKQECADCAEEEAKIGMKLANEEKREQMRASKQKVSEDDDSSEQYQNLQPIVERT